MLKIIYSSQRKMLNKENERNKINAMNAFIFSPLDLNESMTINLYSSSLLLIPSGFST